MRAKKKRGWRQVDEPVTVPKHIYQAFEGVTASGAGPVRPLTVRLPEPGERCPYTGLTRSAINELILPTDRKRRASARQILRDPGECQCIARNSFGRLGKPHLLHPRQ